MHTQSWEIYLLPYSKDILRNLGAVSGSLTFYWSYLFWKSCQYFNFDFVSCALFNLRTKHKTSPRFTFLPWRGCKHANNDRVNALGVVLLNCDGTFIPRADSLGGTGFRKHEPYHGLDAI
jgi:hypothetical protein